MLDRPPTSGRRPGSSSGQRPTSAFRRDKPDLAAGSGGARLPSSYASAARTSKGSHDAMGGLPPRTGGMPGSAMPGTKGGRPSLGRQDSSLGTSIMVVDRPMTQQGLRGIKTGSQGPSRQVQDKTYHLGVLRSKISELQGEVVRMTKEIDTYDRDNSNYLTHEKTAEGLTSQIKVLQRELGEYNVMIDKVSTDTEMNEIINDRNEIANKNEIEAKNLDKIFSERSDKEAKTRELEKEIEIETKKSEAMIEELGPERQENYYTMKSENEALGKEISSKQSKLDELVEKSKALEEEVEQNPIKRQAVLLYEKLQEVKNNRDSMRAELSAAESETPDQERERLLQQVKQDNQEIAGMERRLGEMNENIRLTNEQLEKVTSDLEDYQGERNAKYQELVKRDQEMDQFLNTFDATKAQDSENIKILQMNIVKLLEHITHTMQAQSHLPNQEGFKQVQDELSFKEKEMKKSKTTVDSLSEERRRLQQDLDKVNQLEAKITTELTNTQNKINNMTQELKQYDNIESLKTDTEANKKELYAEKQLLEKRRLSFKDMIQKLSSIYEKKKSQLQDNETHAQLSNLEQKLRTVSQNNFALKEYIGTKGEESDYKQVQEEVELAVDDFNKLLIMSSSGAR
eukprot:Nk52_evm53s240 gene=Nk52_evmTU53s240